MSAFPWGLGSGKGVILYFCASRGGGSGILPEVGVILPEVGVGVGVGVVLV